MTFESYPKSTSMREPNYEQSEKYSIANDDYTVFSVIPLGLRNTPLRITRFAPRDVFCLVPTLSAQNTEFAVYTVTLRRAQCDY